MKYAVLLGLAGAIAATPVLAQEALAQKSGCFACHALDKKLVGPAYKDVAAKYRGQKDAEAKLFKKVKEGGTGVWGTVPMPPNSHVPDADIKALVKWVLSQK
jgi:cytochrome c